MKTTTANNAAFRTKFAALTLLPVIMMFDLNGGLANLGFTKASNQVEFKAKPDYITGNVFVAHRMTQPDMM